MTKHVTVCKLHFTDLLMESPNTNTPDIYEFMQVLKDIVYFFNVFIHVCFPFHFTAIKEAEKISNLAFFGDTHFYSFTHHYLMLF